MSINDFYMLDYLAWNHEDHGDFSDRFLLRCTYPDKDNNGVSQLTGDNPNGVQEQNSEIPDIATLHRNPRYTMIPMYTPA